MREIWKDVVGFEGIYLVSSIGRVKKIKKSPNVFRFLSLRQDEDGYYRTSLFKPGVKKYPFVHTLVAAAFIGPRPEGLFVDHINRVKKDNSVNNLRYVSASVNQLNRGDRENTSSIYNCVKWHKTNKRWVVQLTHNGAKVYLGSFLSDIYAGFVFDRYCTKNRLDRKLNFLGV